jgi:flagellar hook-length control protein FliK
MDANINAIVAPLPVGSGVGLHSSGARASSADPSFGSALAGAVDGTARGHSRSSAPAAKATPQGRPPARDLLAMERTGQYHSKRAAAGPSVASSTADRTDAVAPSHRAAAAAESDGEATRAQKSDAAQDAAAVETVPVDIPTQEPPPAPKRVGSVLVDAALSDGVADAGLESAVPDGGAAGLTEQPGASAQGVLATTFSASTTQPTLSVDPSGGNNDADSAPSVQANRPAALGEFLQAAAGRKGSLLAPQVEADASQPAPAILTAPSGTGAAEPVVAGIRASVARLVDGDLQSPAAKTTVIPAPNRLGGFGSLAFGPNAGLVNGTAQSAADQPALSPAAIEAELTSVQAALQQPIESTAWARGELAKAARMAPEIVQQAQLTMTGAGARGGAASWDGAPGGDAPKDRSSSSSNDAFGLTSGLGTQAASFRLPNAAVTMASSASTINVPEPRTESGPLTESVVRVLKLQWTQGGGEMQLRLRPEHLGELTVVLKVEANAVSATLRSDSAQVRAWIEQHQGDLRAGLKDAGLILDRLSVDPDGRQNEQTESDAHESSPRSQPKRQRATAQFETLI